MSRQRPRYSSEITRAGGEKLFAGNGPDAVSGALQRACEALKKGSCLELYYGSHSVIIEAHAVGFDHDHNPAVLGFERLEPFFEHSGEWRFLLLGEAKEVGVSGYFSEAPQPGFHRNDERFSRIICEV